MIRRSFLFLLALSLSATLATADQKADGPGANSPDGKMRATGDGKAIKVVDAATGKEVLKIAVHKDDVTALLYSPDGKRLYSADAGGTVCGIDVATGKLLWQTTNKAKVTALGVTADGKTLTATTGNKVLEYDPATGKTISEK